MREVETSRSLKAPLKCGPRQAVKPMCAASGTSITVVGAPRKPLARIASHGCDETHSRHSCTSCGCPRCRAAPTPPPSPGAATAAEGDCGEPSGAKPGRHSASSTNPANATAEPAAASAVAIGRSDGHHRRLLPMTPRLPLRLPQASGPRVSLPPLPPPQDIETAAFSPAAAAAAIAPARCATPSECSLIASGDVGSRRGGIHDVGCKGRSELIGCAASPVNRA
mmetsp:Transcript_6803/g.20951  ORF Transcript_6803/g.20951 Transcript_6803/m.20951 type:complete len:224 (-) Transcript_6803:111-782(-)